MSQREQTETAECTFTPDLGLTRDVLDSHNMGTGRWDLTRPPLPVTHIPHSSMGAACWAGMMVAVVSPKRLPAPVKPMLMRGLCFVTSQLVLQTVRTTGCTAKRWR